MRVIHATEEQLTNQNCIMNMVLSSLEELQRRKDMNQYYRGNNLEILKKQVNEDSFITSNNKIRTPFASVISNEITSYFKGNPTVYNTDNEKLLEVLQDNDVNELDYTLALDCSIYGLAMELIYYVDEPRIVRLDPRESIPIYNNELNDELIGLIRIRKETDWSNNNQISYTDVYTKDKIYTYLGDGNYMNLSLINTKPNQLNEVPVVVYKNSSEIMGDFEKCLDLINAYDLMLSTNLDSYDSMLHDSILKIVGVAFGEGEESEAEREQFFTDLVNNKILMLKKGIEESGREDADFISPKTDSNTVDFTLNKLEKLIYDLAQIPNLSSEKFGTANSGVAIKFRFAGLESLCDTKEQLFVKSLYRRIELLSKYLGALGSKVEDINIIMIRDLPTNELENAQVLQIYKNLGVSEETILANIPIVDDINQEQWRKKGDIIDGREQQQQPS